MTFSNIQLPSTDFPQNGNYFYGEKGVLHVNRSGYRILPQPQRRQMPPRPAGAAGTQAAGAPPMPPPPAPIEAKTFRQDEAYDDDPHTKAHARNVLDCVKSRKSPVADITTVGFHVTLPCLLGRLAVKEGRAFGWDGKKAVAI